MIDWDDSQKRKLLREVLQEVYPSIADLTGFVDEELNENLASISSVPALRTVAAELVRWAKSQTRLDELYEKFCSENARNPRIEQLRKDLQDPRAEQGTIGGEDAAGVVQTIVDAELIEDPNSTHLVIAVFWQERNEEKLRISPKLHWRGDTDRSIKTESLVKDDCTVLLKAFPDFFKKIVDFAITKVAKQFETEANPWQLTVELFVPVDLLGRPLTTWCGQQDERWKDRAIVLGCSDRFDPNRSANAANLFNQLKQGWQRFQATVPDQTTSTLKDLAWLTSDQANSVALTDYSGFQCYGDWLNSDAQSVEKWQQLVRSGIPLALWICGDMPPRPSIESQFHDLIDGNRWEFLSRIPRLRERLQAETLHATRGHRVGVFYEDPRYVPDIPALKDEQFFVWPGA